MISGINSITITGIANKAEMSQTQNGDPMLRFTLAGTELGTDENGEPINLPFYRNITVFGRQAERYYPLLQSDKDMTPVFVHGHLTSTSREVNGKMRNELRLRVQELHILAWTGSRMDDDPFHPDQRQQNRLAHAANHATLLGKLVYAMELHQTTNGHFNLKNRLAVNTKTRNYKGEIIENTLFVDIRVWGDLATYHQDLEKGSTLFLQGRLKQHSYERDGQRHYFDYVEAESIEVIERIAKFKQNNPNHATPAQQPEQPIPTAYQAPPPHQPTPEATPEAPAAPIVEQPPLPQPEAAPAAQPVHQQPAAVPTAPAAPAPAPQYTPPAPATQQETPAAAPVVHHPPAQAPEAHLPPQSTAPQPAPMTTAPNQGRAPAEPAAAPAAPQVISREDAPF